MCTPSDPNCTVGNVQSCLRLSRGYSNVCTASRQRLLRLLRDRLLGKGVVAADPENLDVQVLELAVVGLPGREVLCSHRGEIGAIELDEDRILPLKLAQADIFSYRAREREVWRLLPDLQCCSHI